MCLSEGLTGSRAHPAVSLMGFECHWGCQPSISPGRVDGRTGYQVHGLNVGGEPCVWCGGGPETYALKNMGWGKLRGFFCPIFQDIEKCGETSDTKVFVYESRKGEDCVVSNMPTDLFFFQSIVTIEQCIGQWWYKFQIPRTWTFLFGGLGLALTSVMRFVNLTTGSSMVLARRLSWFGWWISDLRSFKKS